MKIKQNQLFPFELLENTTENYLPQISIRSQAIYVITIASILVSLLLLPFIYIDISVQSSGIIRTISEKTEIRSIVSGIIKNINVRENQMIKKNQALFILTTDDLENKIRLNSYQQQEKQLLINDLNELIKIERSTILDKYQINTPLYLQQLNTLKSILQENIFNQNTVKKELDADNYLFSEKAISRREKDAREYEMTALIAKYESTLQQQISAWQADLNRNLLELQQLKTELKNTHIQAKVYEIKSPISRTIQQVNGKYLNSFIQSGEVLCSISPDTSLVVECLVSPADIGLIKKNQSVNFQIDSFNYNEWGLAKGKVIEIGDDFVIIENKPFFKVKCQLNTLHLKLKNGYIGTLKKGMTLQTRFLVTRRSLYQLLYDKIDDWVNPKS